VVA
jgi:hypothetical protein